MMEEHSFFHQEDTFAVKYSWQKLEPKYDHTSICDVQYNRC